MVDRYHLSLETVSFNQEGKPASAIIIWHGFSQSKQARLPIPIPILSDTKCTHRSIFHHRTHLAELRIISAGTCEDSLLASERASLRFHKIYEKNWGGGIGNGLYYQVQVHVTSLHVTSFHVTSPVAWEINQSVMFQNAWFLISCHHSFLLQPTNSSLTRSSTI